MRKVRNKGYIPIRYQLEGARGFAHGWIVEKKDKYWRVFLMDMGMRRIRPAEQKYVKEL